MSSHGLALQAIEPTRRFGRIAYLATIFVSASALLYSLPLEIGVPAAALLAIGLAWQAWRLGFIGRRYRVSSLRCNVEGDWQVLHRGAWLSAWPRPESRVWRRLIWLGWNTDSGVVWTLIARPGVAPGAWRQLQARLRLSNAVHSSPSSAPSQT